MEARSLFSSFKFVEMCMTCIIMNIFYHNCHIRWFCCLLSFVSNFPGLASYFGKLMVRIGCLQAAVVLHKCILVGKKKSSIDFSLTKKDKQNVFPDNALGVQHAPMDFFETTPIGRILSRFSRDIEILDNVLPMHLIDFIVCSIEVNINYWSHSVD